MALHLFLACHHILDELEITRSCSLRDMQSRLFAERINIAQLWNNNWVFNEISARKRSKFRAVANALQTF